MDTKRVAVFIDISNVLHNILRIRQMDPKWACLYNPLKLAEKLAGQRMPEKILLHIWRKTEKEL